MKIRLTYFLVLLIGSLFLASANRTEGSVRGIDSGYRLPSSYCSGTSINVASRDSQSKLQRSEENEEGTQFRQATEATINTSVIPATQNILTLIAVLRLCGKEANPLTQSLPRQSLLHKIMFRVFVSANAP